jgi:hypothetical protein
VTWTAPEGNVSRRIVQSRRDSESPQPAKATKTTASSIVCRERSLDAVGCIGNNLKQIAGWGQNSRLSARCRSRLLHPGA